MNLRRLGLVLLVLWGACAERIAPPVAHIALADADAPLVVGRPVQLDGSGSSDPEGRRIVFAWSFAGRPAGSTAALNSTTVVNPSFTPDLPGPYVARLVVSNGVLESDPATLDLDVLPCGAAPPVVKALAASPSMPNTGQVVELSATVSDPDDETCPEGLGAPFRYAWSLVAVPPGSGARLNAPAAANPSFVPDLPGTYVVGLVVTDAAGIESERAEHPVMVSVCGGARPVVDEIVADPAAPNTGETVQIDATVTDADNDPPCGLGQAIEYAWAIVEAPPGSTAALNDPAARNPSFTPDMPGDYMVELVVTDSTGRASDPESITVTADVCGSNAPDVGEIAFAPVAPMVDDAIALSAPATDADNDPPCDLAQALAWEWALLEVPPGSAADLGEPLAATPSFTADVGGPYVVGVVVTDPTGRTGAAEVWIDVSPCGGFSPVVEAVTHDPAAPFTWDLVTVTVAASDEDNGATCALGQTLFYESAMVVQPPGSTAALSNPEAVEPWFVADAPGTYVVATVVTDETGRESATELHAIDVSVCGSAAPSATVAAAPSATVAVGQAVQVTAAVTDADDADPCLLAQAFAYEWSLSAMPAGSLAALNAPAAANPSITPDMAGTYVIEVVVTDDRGVVGDPAAIAITALPCGTVPPDPGAIVAVPGSPAAGQEVALSAPGARDSDQDAPCALGQLFTYAWELLSQPAGSAASIDEPSRAAPSLAVDVAGDYVVELTLTDSTGLAGVATAAITAGACGDRPPHVGEVVATLPFAAVGQSVALAAPGAMDPDNVPPCAEGQTLSYAWSLTSAPAGSAAALDDPAAATPSLTPDLPGTYVIGLVLTDSGAAPLSSSGSVTVVAGACGDNAPSVVAMSSSPASPAAGDAVTLDAVVTDADNVLPCAEGQTFTRAWQMISRPAGSAATLSSPTFTADVAGSYVARVVVTDSTGLASSRVLAVDASDCGENPPSAGAITATTFAPAVGQDVQVSAPDATDADIATCGLAETLSYAWSLAELPAGSAAALNSPSAANPSFSPDVEGTYRVRLVLTDSTGRSDMALSDPVVAGPCGANAPTLGAAGIVESTTTPAVGGAVTLSAPDVADADNAAACGLSQTLSYSWTFEERPAGSAAALTTATGASPSFVADVAGTYRIRLTVTDSTGRSVTGVSDAVVAGPCGANAPTLGASGIVESTLSPAVGGSVTLSAPTVADADNAVACGLSQTLSYSWTFEERPAGSAAALTTTGGASPSFVADLAGTYRVRLTVTDSTGRSATGVSDAIVAGPCGANAPTLGASGIVESTLSPAVGGDVTLTAPDVADADNAGACSLGQTLSYSWTFEDRPAGSAAALSTTTGPSPAFSPDVAGTYRIRLTVTDSTGRSVTGVSDPIVAGPCGVNAPNALVQMIEPFVTAPGSAVTVGPTVDNCEIVQASAAATTDADAVTCGLSDPLTYEWSFDLLPPGSFPAPSATSLNPSFLPDVAGTYRMRVTVTDSTGLQDFATLTFNAEGAVFTCGDGACDVGCGETGCTCLADCATTCGDGCCTGVETACACPGDCAGFCGDGCCSVAGGETDCTCPGDCGFTCFTSVPVTIVGASLSAPQGVTVEPVSGNIYVVNNGTDEIIEVTPGGAGSIFVPAGGCIAGAPQDIVFDPASSFFFVTDGADDQICRVTTAGVQVLWADTGASGLNSPRSIANWDTCSGANRLAVTFIADDTQCAYDAFAAPGTFEVAGTCSSFGGLLASPRGAEAACLFTGANFRFGTRTGGDQGVQRRIEYPVGSQNQVLSSTLNAPVIMNDPRDVILTPCPRPDLIVATMGGDSVVWVENCGIPPCPTAAITSVGAAADPWGLWWEDPICDPLCTLLVTHSGSNTLNRLTGPFCALGGGAPCPDPAAGAGAFGFDGAVCLATYTFPTMAGKSYTISTCGSFAGDPFVVVSGSCTCTNDDFCADGAQCSCTATTTGTATICASTAGASAAVWDYFVLGNCAP